MSERTDRAQRDEVDGLKDVPTYNDEMETGAGGAIQPVLDEYRDEAFRQGYEPNWQHKRALEFGFHRGYAAKSGEIEEDEAGCCPEDVGFVEYIKRLESKIDAGYLAASQKNAQRDDVEAHRQIDEKFMTQTEKQIEWFRDLLTSLEAKNYEDAKKAVEAAIKMLEKFSQPTAGKVPGNVGPWKG